MGNAYQLEKENEALKAEIAALKAKYEPKEEPGFGATESNTTD